MPNSASPHAANTSGASQPRQAMDWHSLIVSLSAITAVLIGGLAFSGWLLDFSLLKSVLPGAAEMKANTALGLMAAGGALWLLGHPRAGILRATGLALALLVVALGLATLGQYLFGWRLGIDELLFDDTLGKYTAFRGRMSPFSAAAFASIGLSLAVLARGKPWQLASAAAGATLVTGTLSTLGYLWNASEITTDLLFPPVALNTAVALMLLGVGTLLAAHRQMVAASSASLKLSSMESKVLAGFVGSFLLLAVGGGLTYKAIAVFADSAQLVAHTQKVRGTLSELSADLSDAGFSQRNYLITGERQQLAEFERLAIKIDTVTWKITLLVWDNPRQVETMAALSPIISRTLALLEQGVDLYERQGFAAAKKLVDTQQSMNAMRSIAELLQRMDSEEARLLTEREAASARFQRYMLISMLLTMVVATCIFAFLFREIRQEIRARQRADEALVAARDAAERSREEADAANKEKSTFLATMSHEIRTPMNGMLGMLELLSLSRLDGGQHTTLKVIRESGRSLMRIIDDILDFSKMEALKLEIQPEVISLKHLVEEFHSLYAGNASSKGLTITCRVDPALSPAVMADPIRLRQILNNLVSNAIKFTSQGQIDIAAEVIEKSQTHEKVRFTVKDTGIGISKAHQLRLFQPFAQAELSTARRYGGSGLGLAICRRLADLMGGTIGISSEPGKGTTMTLELSLPVADEVLLPARESATSEPSLFGTAGVRREHPSVAQAAAEGTLVLVADDHPTNRTLLLRQVNLLGYAAECARNGVEALALWETGRFNLLVTDCNMPEMDGYELTRTIRAREAATGARRLPIVACTANALSGEIEICLNAGMDDYLAKPVELKNLLVKLDRWLPLPSAVGLSPNSSHPAPASRTQPPIDHAALARVSAGNASVEREIFAEFQLANDEDTALLHRAVVASDSAEVKRLAHLIKGASTMVGALALADICQRIEQANQRGDWDAVTAELKALDHEVRALNVYFHELRQTTALS